MKKLLLFFLIQSCFILSAGAHCGSCGVGDAHSEKKSDCNKEKEDGQSCSSKKNVSNVSDNAEGVSTETDSTATSEKQ